MLIAGFSCVDFSNLNHSKKTLADCGESGDTFWSILQYIIKYRPPMVILENVKSAPWETIQRIFQNDIEWLLEFNGDSKFLEHAWPKNDPGYAAEYSYVDSKEYYIPQTRQRGYIILIDRKFRFADSQAKAWKDVMDVFKRPASSGFEAFLLTPEDPELRRAMNEVITAEAKSASNWDLCRIRNRGYRQQNGLGFGQPLTRSGRGQDHWQVGLVPQLGARIGDVLDIAHLRSAVRGFDNTHKAYVTDSSIYP